MLGLCFCTRAFSSCVEWGLLFVAAHQLLIAPLVARHGLQGARASVVEAHGLSCPAACGVPGEGIKFMSPALAGRFLTMGPLRKSLKLFLL